MLRLSCLLVALLCLCGHTQADVVGGKIGLNLWSQSFQPSTRKGGEVIDLDARFDMDSEVDFYGYIAIEHPLPLLPNLLLQHSAITTDGPGELAGELYDGAVLSGAVSSELDLTHTDLTAYYELLDNWVNLDVGLTLRSFDAGVSLAAVAGGSGDFNFDDVVPMAYGLARFDLPLTGWYLQTDANYFRWESDEIVDMKAGLGWELFAGLGLELGYRYLDVDYSAGGGDIQVDVQGVYGGVFWDF